MSRHKARNVRHRAADAYFRYLCALGDDVLVPWSVIAYINHGRNGGRSRSSRQRKRRDGPLVLAVLVREDLA